MEKEVFTDILLVLRKGMRAGGVLFFFYFFLLDSVIVNMIEKVEPTENRIWRKMLTVAFYRLKIH